MAFCRRLTEREQAAGRLPAGREYRLPTEAEWEYACRAGSTTRFAFGDDEGSLGEYAWYDVNSGYQTQEVGTRKPNAWGLCDLHGNVWEWCLDWYDSYPMGSVTDPTGAAAGSSRVLRGGSWNGAASDCTSAFRNGYSPSSPNVYYGFRLALPAGP